MTSHDDPVVVVGAGLAGLHAAWLLRRAGVEVVVLEARDRVGGRAWSHTLANGAVVERGGEFIAPDQMEIQQLCGTLGLELIPHGFSFDLRPMPQTPAPTPEERAAVMAAARERVLARLDAGAPDMPAAEAFAAPQAWSAVERNVIMRLETSSTVPLRAVSAQTLTADDHHYDPAVRVRGGNQLVALELAKRLGSAVHLRTPVRGVAHDENGATVRCATGDPVHASAVVLAVPLPLLLELELEPGLPDAVAGAATRVRFGDAAKLHVPLAGSPAAGAMASPSDTWWCWTSQSASDPQAAPVLSGFAGGESAIAALGVADGAGSWASAALSLRPDVVPDGDPYLTHWGAERWTRGSYSASGIGATAADDQAWATRWGRIVFAGEHTAGEQSATMNGAVASGARTAGILLTWAGP